MPTYFNASFFSANRAALRAQVGSDAPIVIAGNGLLQRTADSTYPFQQDSNFWYLTGLDEPDLVLVMAEGREYLLAPSRDAVRQAFDGTVDVAALTVRSGVASVESERNGWTSLRQLLAGAPEVLVTGNTSLYNKRHGFWANPAACRLHRKLKRTLPNLKLTNIDTALAELRVHKQPAELKAIRAAIAITTETIADVRQHMAGYKHEYQVEAAISQGFRVRGASGHSFNPIVANGTHATVLHHVANNGPLNPGELTVMDIGAEVEHYAADITRTLSTRKPTSRQQSIYQAVLDVQNYALSLLKPGVLLRDYEREVALQLSKQLQKLGLITMIDHASVRRYFPHATSHFLGLDVHDVGDYSKPLQAGMVLTCEPGIYIPEEGIGIRLEDDVLLTKTGNQVLSDACPRDLFTVQ